MPPPLQLGLGMGLSKGGGTLLDPEALAYKDATSLSSDRTLRISNFFKGLDALGIRSDFVDGAVFRADSNANGSTAYSLRGLANATLTGSPEWRRNGLYFDGVDDWALASIPDQTGARTFVTLHAGSLDNADTTPGDTIAKFDRSNGYFAQMQHAGVTGLAGSFAGTARTISPLTWSRNTERLAMATLRDDALEDADSFSHQDFGFLAGAKASTQGEPSHMLNRLVIGTTANAGLTSFYRYTERLVAGWLIFNGALTDTQCANLSALLRTTLFPQVRWVWEGDSITNFLRQRAHEKCAAFWGANMDFVQVQAGGETSAEGGAQLGTANGLNTGGNLDGDVPAIASVWFGANDLGAFSAAARPVATIHANLRTIWAYAKAAGVPVVAWTVMRAGSIDSNSREADRQLLNALIAADEGIYYDVLVDADAAMDAATATEPYYDDASLFADTTHPATTAGGGCDVLSAALSTAVADLLTTVENLN
jgi:hypothetical protein